MSLLSEGRSDETREPRLGDGVFRPFTPSSETKCLSLKRLSLPPTVSLPFVQPVKCVLSVIVIFIHSLQHSLCFRFMCSFNVCLSRASVFAANLSFSPNYHFIYMPALHCISNLPSDVIRIQIMGCSYNNTSLLRICLCLYHFICIAIVRLWARIAQSV
jgi:hypothetical protein